MAEAQTKTTGPAGRGVVESCVAGLISGVFSSVLLQPLEMIKTRMQGQPYQTRLGFLTTFSNVVKNEGLLILWSGLTPSLYRVVPGVTIYFPLLRYLETKLLIPGERANSLENMALGTASRGVVTFFLMPTSVLKSRFESNLYRYPSFFGGLKTIIKTEGFKGLYSGVVPTFGRDALYAGFYLVLYRKQLNSMPPEWLDRSCSWAPLLRFCCGLSAGCLSCYMTMPFDFVKTHMQLQPHLYATSLGTLLVFYKSDGVLVFFRGVVPRALRRGLMAALSWTIYEELVHHIVEWTMPNPL